MRYLLLSVFAFLVLAGSATCTLGQSPSAQLPHAEGLAVETFGGCGGLVLVSDGSFRTGFAWQYEGLGAGGVGAFASRIQTPWSGTICSVALYLTQTPHRKPKDWA